MTSSRDDVTRLLQAARGGEHGASEALAERVYGELRQIAERLMRRDEGAPATRSSRPRSSAKPGSPSTGERLRVAPRTSSAPPPRRCAASSSTPPAGAVHAAKRGGGRERSHPSGDVVGEDRRRPTLDLLALDDGAR
jgi:hypothetical protein